MDYKEIRWKRQPKANAKWWCVYTRRKSTP
nr:MAG TPA: hypothetical protein [Caudoviricetes sp.]